MTTEPTIGRRRIYQDVYGKRTDERSVTSSAEGIEIASVADGALAFDGGGRAFDRALSEGVFFLRIPSWIAVTGGDACAQGFFRGPEDPQYGQLRMLGPERFPDPLLGFHERSNQIEQFLLERRFWLEGYPLDVVALGEDLTLLSRYVVRSVLDHVGLPDQLWHRATGGCSDAEGSYHLTFNHYRPTVDEVGLSSHKDDGFVTLLRATDPGLEINRHGRWESVDPDPGHFIVNFGLAMQLLTCRCSHPVEAIMHRVARQQRDRTTFGHFSSSRCDGAVDAGIHRFDPTTGLERICGARELIDLNDYEIYEGTDDPGGDRA